MPRLLGTGFALPLCIVRDRRGSAPGAAAERASKMLRRASMGPCLWREGSLPPPTRLTGGALSGVLLADRSTGGWRGGGVVGWRGGGGEACGGCEA